MSVKTRLLAMVCGILICRGDFATADGIAAEHQVEAEAFLRELVSFESTAEKPEEVRGALMAVARRLVDAGFDEKHVQLVNPWPDTYGLVARLPGSGFDQPLLVLSHVDVVPAVIHQWDFPPFTLGKKDGLYLGRGVDDNKTGIVQTVGNMIRLKKEGWVPRRDVVAFISGDEETVARAAEWMASEGRYLADAGLVLNTDAGYIGLDRKGEPEAFWLQTSEKLYQTYRLTTRNPGGHSSLPRKDNAIRDLAEAIVRISNYEFPIRINAGTRIALRRAAKMYPPAISRDMLMLAEAPHDRSVGERLARSDPELNTWLRTTCVPTRLNAGHADNALPREASVIVQCRIMPGVDAVEVQRALEGAVDGLGVEFEVTWDGLPSEASPLPAALLERFEALVSAHWPDLPVIPTMSSGATDGLYFRNAGMPVYGLSGIVSRPGGAGAHGLNEHIGIRAFHESVAFWYDLIRTMGE